jgi:hypothetical protein
MNDETPQYTIAESAIGRLVEAVTMAIMRLRDADGRYLNLTINASDAPNIERIALEALGKHVSATVTKVTPKS